METVQSVASVLAWFVSVPLVILILLQSGSGDLSSNFGGGQLDSSLGVGASKKMAQVTGALAITFLVLVILLGIRVDSLESLSLPSEADSEESVEVAPVVDEVVAPAEVVESVSAPAEASAPQVEIAAPEVETTAPEVETATEMVEETAEETPGVEEASTTPVVEAAPEEGSAPAIELED